MKKSHKLREEITHALNRASTECGSDTPDYVLAEFMLRCLEAFDAAVVARGHFYESPTENFKRVPGRD